MAYHYTVPPPGYPILDYSSSSTQSLEDHPFYIPQYHSPISSSSSRRPSTSERHHVRTATWTQPQVAGWHSPGGYSSPGYYSTPIQSTYPSPSQGFTYVSTQDSHNKQRTRRYSLSGHGKVGGNTHSDGSQKCQASARQQKQHIFVDAAAEARAYDSSADEPVFTYIEPRPARTTSTRKLTRKADSYFFFNQNEGPEADTPTRSRRRRSSTNTKPKTSPKPVPEVRIATPADAAEHNIPAGYSLKNWDPTEEPIVLLGSVFDANSLGKWIYDWTVYYHRAGAPMTEVAGELWLLLIKFAGKMKRAEECLPRIQSRSNWEVVKKFHDSAAKIWANMVQILRDCERFMWNAAKRDGSKGQVRMGEKSGIEFVMSIFGRERKLEDTERLMTSMRIWNMKFDAKCDKILRRPSSRSSY